MPHRSSFPLILLRWQCPEQCGDSYTPKQPGPWFSPMACRCWSSLVASSRQNQIMKLDLFLSRHLVVRIRVTPQLGHPFLAVYVHTISANFLISSIIPFMHLKGSLWKIVKRHGSGYRHVKFLLYPCTDLYYMSLILGYDSLVDAQFVSWREFSDLCSLSKLEKGMIRSVWTLEAATFWNTPAIIHSWSIFCQTPAKIMWYIYPLVPSRHVLNFRLF